MTGTGRALLGVVRFYQRAVSPALPPRCRFVPTCSSYAVEAIEVHGAGRGSWLAVRRIAKCAPWHRGGVDLVPPRRPDPGDGSRPGDGSHPGAGSAGTTGSTHSSCTAAPVTSQGRRPYRAPRPTSGRTPPQEAGVA